MTKTLAFRIIFNADSIENNARILPSEKPLTTTSIVRYDWSGKFKMRSQLHRCTVLFPTMNTKNYLVTKTN